MKEFDVVDARGLSCPQPVILTKRALQAQNNKAVVIVDNDVAMDNIIRFAESRDLKCSVEEKNDDYIITIE